MMTEVRNGIYIVIDSPDSDPLSSLGTSKKTLAVVFKLPKLGFPRLPYGPVLFQELRELFPLFLLCARNKSKRYP
jgi:hypothetical protein